MTRFGGFAYPHTAAVDNSRVLMWLPPSASDITVYCAYQGHRARFHIEKTALVDWFNTYRGRFGIRGSGQPLTAEELQPKRMDAEYFKIYFENLAWDCPLDFIEMNCTVADNGKGFTIWYSDTLEIAFLRAGYW